MTTSGARLGGPECFEISASPSRRAAFGDIVGGQCCINIRQITVHHRAGFAEMPGVIAASLRMLAEHDNLLAVAKHLDMMLA
jgi:hypothetical protein